jgi:hypothetical protein
MPFQYSLHCNTVCANFPSEAPVTGPATNRTPDLLTTAVTPVQTKPKPSLCSRKLLLEGMYFGLFTDFYSSKYLKKKFFRAFL